MALVVGTEQAGSEVRAATVTLATGDVGPQSHTASLAGGLEPNICFSLELRHDELEWPSKRS